MEKKKFGLLATGAIALMLSASACSTMQMGAGGTDATGAAGGENAQNANAGIEHCAKTLGTVAIADGVTAGAANTYIVTNSPTMQNAPAILKLIAQQSGCFIVVDRGAGMAVASQDRALRDSGELRKTSHHHKGQVVAADYSLVPSLVAEGSSGRGTAAVGGLLGGIWGTVAGAMQSKDAAYVVSLVDNRSSVQVASAQGSGRAYDFGGLGGLFGRSLGGSLGAFANTPEGKVQVSALIDGFNQVVKAAKNYKAQKQHGGLGSGGALKVSE